VSDVSNDKRDAQVVDPVKEPTYGEIVWGQFKKNRLGMAALYAFIVLVLIAIGAPLISSDQPFTVLYEGERRYPWFEGLLFNSNVFGKGVDVFFNLLLVLLPVIIPAYLIFRRTRMRGIPGRERRRRRARFVKLWLLLLAGLFVALLAFQPQKAVPRWKAEVEAGTATEAVFPVLAYSYLETSYNANRGPMEGHILGTDSTGRDQFTRMLYGTRISLTIGVIAVFIYLLIGVTLGSLAGFLGGRTDIVIQRLIEVVMCFPPFILILTFMSLLPNKSIFWIMLFIGITRWTTVARLVRGEFLRLKQVDFVQAAIAAGLKTRQVIFRHVMPNALGPVLVNATFGVAAAILIEAALSFLGVADLEAPSWGRILKDGRDYNSLYTMLLPGLAIFFTVAVLNVMGEALRDAMDPKLRK